MARHLRDYSLGYALALLWFLSWGLHAWFLARVEDWSIGDTLTRPEFWRQTMENWQSEFLQVLTFVALSKWLLFKGSPESKE